MVSSKLSQEKLKDALVHQSKTIEETLKSMDNEVAVITDDAGRMCGLVTDGDIRRAFLSGATMKTPVGEIMTRHPFAINDTEELTPGEIMAIMLERQIRHLPVIDTEGFPVGLELLRDQYGEDGLVPAVIMAGGKGTRLYPLTADTPKPLLKVGDQAIIDNVVSGLHSCGVKNIAVSVNYLGEQIKQHFADQQQKKLNIEFLEEKEALGTAGALTLLEPRPDRAFLVMNADLLTDIDYQSLVRFHRDGRYDFSVCVRKVEEPIPFGVVTLSDSKMVSGIQEKPVHSYLINAGIYMIEPHVIDLIPPNRYFDMVSLIKTALANNCKVGAFPIYEYWRDIGRHQEIAQADQEWQQRQHSTLK